MADPLSSLGNFSGGIAQLTNALFPADTKISGSGSSSGTTKQRLEIEDEAIERIINDVLGGAGGLAEIFSGEQTAGIFDSSVAAQASGDLASKLVGELAKLRAEQVTETKQTSTQQQTQDKEGPIEKLGNLFGF